MTCGKVKNDSSGVNFPVNRSLHIHPFSLSHCLTRTLSTEKELLDVTTKEDKVICHFFHPDFRRCSIMTNHLRELARRHYSVTFVQLEGSAAPFLAVKLKISVLPSVLVFMKGVVKDRLVGFEDLGNSDSFPTRMLEVRM